MLPTRANVLHDYYEIDPETGIWSMKTRLGYGVVAFLPLLLLLLAGALGLYALAADARVVGAAAMLLYVHVGTQFIVLLIYGHLLMDHPDVGPSEKLLWAASFLALAPATVPAFWLVHVLGEGADPIVRGEIHVREAELGRRGWLAGGRGVRDEGSAVIHTLGEPTPELSIGPEPSPSVIATLGLLLAIPFVPIAFVLTLIMVAPLAPFAVVALPFMLAALVRWPTPRLRTIHAARRARGAFTPVVRAPHPAR